MLHPLAGPCRHRFTATLCSHTLPADSTSGGLPPNSLLPTRPPAAALVLVFQNPDMLTRAFCAYLSKIAVEVGLQSTRVAHTQGPGQSHPSELEIVRSGRRAAAQLEALASIVDDLWSTPPLDSNRLAGEFYIRRRLAPSSALTTARGLSPCAFKLSLFPAPIKTRLSVSSMGLVGAVRLGHRTAKERAESSHCSLSLCAHFVAMFTHFVGRPLFATADDEPGKGDL